jgi:ribosomal-protein-alanine N-acetyltransferase
MASVELRTTRLRFRDFELGDYQAVHAFATDLAVVSYVDWGPNTPQETEAFLRGAIASADVCPRRRYAFALVLHSNAERLIGSIELRVVSFEHRRGEIGYVLAREWWGMVMQLRPLAGCLPLVSTSAACTRSPLPVIRRIALKLRS